MKKQGIFFIFFITLAASLTLAQVPGRAGGPPPVPGVNAGQGGPGLPPGDQAVPVLTQLLELTEAQQASWQTIREQTKATADPLAEQARTLKDEVKALLDAGSADAATVGTKVIAAAAVDAQIKTALDAGKTAFKALLTSDQLAKLAVFEEIQELTKPQGPPR
jgi:Spy/CpxP family protein refolding chaperone